MKSPIALVAGDFVATGGMDRANLALAAYLARGGHELHLIAHRADPALASLPGVHFHRVRKPLRSYLLGGALLDRAGRQWGRRVRGLGGQIVVNGGNCLAGGVNWVHYVHHAYRPSPKGPMLRRGKALIAAVRARERERLALQRAELVIANSKRTARDLVDRLGVSIDRIKRVYYGIDADRFRPPTHDERTEAARQLGWTDGRRRAVFIGGLGDSRKGFDLLFEAWRMLGATGRDWQLIVVGRGSNLEAWRRRARDAGLSGGIAFLGFRDDVPRLLAASDVLVAPTRYEAYGLGVHEALCCGLPAIVSSTAGVAERYPPDLQPLLLPSAPTPVDLAERLRWCIGDLDEWARPTQALAEVLRARTWDVMAAEILAAMGSRVSTP